MKRKIFFVLAVALLLCCSAALSFAASFVNNGNGTVTDYRTGLVWQQGEPGSMTWGSALSYCEGLNLGNKTDWRLPNIKELESITDDTRYNPAIDINYFPNAYASHYWSSTTYASNPGYAWYVYFGNGYVYSSNKYSYIYVRCVRGGQSGSFGPLVIVSPVSGSWTSSPQYIGVSSSGATTIYYRMVNTYEGSTPSDPSDPTPSSNDGSISGPGGTFVYYGNGGQLKKTKLKFVGCDSSGCGPVSSVLSYTMDLRNTSAGHVSVSNLSVLPDPVMPGQNFTVNFSMDETLGYAESLQKISVAILRSDDQLVFDCKIYDNVTINANQTWSDTATCQLYTTSPAGTYKAIIRGKHTGGNWFDFDTTGGGTNPVSFQSITNNPQTVSISGKVLDMNKSPVSGALVKLMSSTDELLSQGASDANGNYAFQATNGSQYSISAEKSGLCLQGGPATGSTFPFTLYFAQPKTLNINLQCSDSDKLPVIIIPGVMGSTKASAIELCRADSETETGCYPEMLREEGLDSSNYKILSPVIWTFTSSEEDAAGRFAISGELRNAGYRVIELPWDGRVKTDKAAGIYLKKKIDEVKSRYNVNKVHVVAHSQGGLVTRAYIEGLAKDINRNSISYGDDIAKFIMLGTPNGGAANSYWMLEGGDPLAIDDLLGPKSTIAMFYSETINRLYKLNYVQDAIGFGGINDYKVSRQDLANFYATNVRGAYSLMGAYDLLFCSACDSDGQARVTEFNNGIDRYKWLRDLNRVCL